MHAPVTKAFSGKQNQQQAETWRPLGELTASQLRTADLPGRFVTATW